MKFIYNLRAKDLENVTVAAFGKEDVSHNK
jgi:hypothetical protein